LYGPLGIILALMLTDVGSASAAESDVRIPLPTSIPIKIVDRLPFVVATVNGETLRLRFDTGAYDAGVALTSSEMARVNPTFRGVARVADALGHISETRTFEVAELRLENFVLKDVPGAEYKLVPGNEPPGRTGHIGLRPFWNYLLVVNFAISKVELRMSGDFPFECGTDESELERSDVGVASVLRGDSAQLKLGWDAAAQANLLSPQAIGIELGKFEVGELHTIVGRIGSATHEEISFRLVPISIPGLDGLLGYDYFADHVVCLDLPALRVRAKKWQRSAAPPNKSLERTRER
jgi:hypothetical protein